MVAESFPSYKMLGKKSHMHAYSTLFLSHYTKDWNDFAGFYSGLNK